MEYFLQKFLHLSRADVDSLLLEYGVDYSLSFLDDYKAELQISYEEMPSIIADYDLTRVPTWIFDRDFTKETLLDWKCGADIDGSLVIPVYDMRWILVGTITRRLNMTPKYLYSKGLKKSQVLFGANKLLQNDFVCITEGSLDAIWLSQNGFPAVSLLGASMSRIQEDLLLQLPTNELVLCLDNDEAGKIGMSKALTTLSNRCKVSRINLPGGYKDVQDIRDVDILKETVQQRTYW